MRRLLFSGGILGFLAVALGAFGAHGLKERLSEYSMDIYQTGVQYHMAHALSMVIAALLADRLSGRQGERLVIRAGWSFAIGIVLFSGSLYALAVSGVTWLGAITPLGGVAFLIGWSMLAAAGLKK